MERLDQEKSNETEIGRGRTILYKAFDGLESLGKTISYAGFNIILPKILDRMNKGEEISRGEIK